MERLVVANAGDQVVGHVLFSRIWLYGLNGERRAAALLAPLAVHPQWAGQGVGSALVRSGLALLRKQGESLVLVRGHPEYYRRLGFVAADLLGVAPPFPLPPQEYSALRLSGTVAEALTIHYPEAFAVLGYPVDSD